EADLPERTPTRAEYDGEPVLLYRNGEALHALAATCAHAGGPLDEGTVEGCDDCRCTDRCPWHDTVFGLRDGAIVHGPTVHRQPARHGSPPPRRRPHDGRGTRGRCCPSCGRSSTAHPAGWRNRGVTGSRFARPPGPRP